MKRCWALLLKVQQVKKAAVAAAILELQQLIEAMEKKEQSFLLEIQETEVELKNYLKKNQFQQVRECEAYITKIKAMISKEKLKKKEVTLSLEERKKSYFTLYCARKKIEKLFSHPY